MSVDVQGGIDYAQVKRFFLCDDYISMAYGAAQDYYVVGSGAVLATATVIDATRGWTLFTHGQAAAPAWWTALGLPAALWPAQAPAFEGKDFLFLSTTDCWIRFEGPARVQHRIPAATFMRFHRRCFIFWVQQVAAAGTLQAWIEG